MSKVIVINVSEDGKKSKKPTINLCGFHDGAGNLFPETNGSGKCGKIRIGDLFDISAECTLGGKLLPIGSEIRALDNKPGQNPAKWSCRS